MLPTRSHRSGESPQSAPPVLSDAQMQAAREAATRARRRRSEVKNALKEGQVSLRGVLEQAAQDDTVAHIKVADLLKALPRVGEKKARRIMERLDIAPNRRIRGLGSNQIQGLLGEFE